MDNKIAGLLAFFAANACLAQSYDITTFTAGAGIVQVSGVASSGEVGGYLTLATGDGASPQNIGFLYFNGSVTPIKASNAGPNGSTQISGVNAQGYAVGSYISTAVNPHGSFLISPAGSFHYFGPSNNPNYFVTAQSLNNVGEIVGQLFNGTITQGFKILNGSFTTFQAPGQTFTAALGVNNAGVIVGEVGPPASTSSKGFVYDGSAFNIISYPGSPSTVLTGINDDGVAAGYYYVPGGGTTTAGFLYQAGMITPVSLPELNSFQILGINDTGTIWGNYLESNTQGGFVAVPIQSGPSRIVTSVNLGDSRP